MNNLYLIEADFGKLGKAFIETDRDARPRFLPAGECLSCDIFRNQAAPAHFASARCESGKHNHCSCDVCF